MKKSRIVEISLKSETQLPGDYGKKLKRAIERLDTVPDALDPEVQLSDIVSFIYNVIAEWIVSEADFRLHEGEDYFVSERIGYPRGEIVFEDESKIKDLGLKFVIDLPDHQWAIPALVCELGNIGEILFSVQGSYKYFSLNTERYC